jgi:hypothetical protein
MARILEEVTLDEQSLRLKGIRQKLVNQKVVGLQEYRQVLEINRDIQKRRERQEYAGR